MATYATYRHVELDNVGYGKKRVLKPPGGGSSDIFGANSGETSPRRVKHHNQSQLGSALYGGSESSSGSIASTGNSSPESPRVNKPAEKLSCMSRNPITGEGINIPLLKGKKQQNRDATDSTSQSVNSSTASMNGDTKSSINPSLTSGSQARTRVPPGGFSSGLW